jgi:hypothetical protein
MLVYSTNAGLQYIYKMLVYSTNAGLQYKARINFTYLKMSFNNFVPRAFPFLSLGRREKALAPGGHMTFNTQI